MAGEKGVPFGEEPPALPEWMDAWRSEQLASASALDVFHEFEFADERPTSGISFQHLITPDSSIDHRLNHYDHANGVAAADVDGDGLTDLYFVNQLGGNELWRNLGAGRFVEATTPELALEERVGSAVAFGDLDNDGDPDLVVTSVRYGNTLFENDGTGRFADVSRRAGVDYVGHSSAPVLFDYNRDGLLDLYVTNVGVFTTNEEIEAPGDLNDLGGQLRFLCFLGTYNAFTAHLDPRRDETSILYRNTGDLRFEDVTERTGLIDRGWSGDATPIDGNADGWPDLYTLNMQGHDDYFENVRGVGFVRKGATVFPHTPFGSMGVKAFDYNNDGLQDILVTDMHSDMISPQRLDRQKEKEEVDWRESFPSSEGLSIWGNALHERQIDGSYTEVSDATGAENYWPWGVSVGDLNADGWDDVFIASSMNMDFRYHPNSVLLNNRGERFVDSEFVLGVEPRRDEVAYQPWYTLDCGGEHWDHGNCVDNSLTETTTFWEPVGSRSSVVVDLERDGDLDIVTLEWHGPPQVLVSDLSDRTDVHHLSIRLEGTTSNRDGLGARVTVAAGDRRLVRFNDGKSGYLAQSSLPLYIGLGDAPAADRVTVLWPSGTRQVVEGPLTGDVVIVEAES